MNSTTVQLASAAFGILGTILLAFNGPRAGWGFVAYLASNAGWGVFAWTHAYWGLLAQQIAFTVTSLVGIWIWLLRPWCRKQVDRLDIFLDEGLF